MVSPQKIQGPGNPVKFCVSEAVIDKLQACATPKNMKEVQAFVGDLGVGGDFYSPPGLIPPSLIPPGKEKEHVGLGVRAASRL